MRAIHINAFGAAEELRPVELAEPVPGPGQVLIRVVAASVNRADVLLRSGSYHILPDLPVVPGSEGAGIVERVGSGVTELASGDRVVAWGGSGLYAEFALVDGSRTMQVPEAVPLRTAAALPLTWLTARYCLRELGRVSPGETVLVHAAASAVGAAAVQTALADGASVIAIVGADDKATFVRGLGAEHVVDRKRTDVVAAVLESTGGRGADVVFDLVGGDAFATSLRSVAAGGRVVSIANVAGAPSVIDTRDFYPRNVTIHGFQFTDRQRSGWDPRPDLAALLGEVNDGRWSVPIDSAFPLREAAAAHRRVESNRTRGKVVLDVSEEAD